MYFRAAIAVAIVSYAGSFLLSYVFGGWVAGALSPAFSFDDIPDLTGKHVVVTGANSGIGYVTARELARKGASVFATCRDPTAGERALRGMQGSVASPLRGSVEFLKMDLSSLQSVRDFASQITERNVSVDLLILNAGVMFVPYMETTDGFEWQFGVNHLGHFLLVKLLLNNLIPGSRVVHVSSIGHYFTYSSEGIRFDQLDNGNGYNPVQAYGQSKLANILFSNALARRLEGTGVSSNALHPGSINTNLFRHVDPLHTVSAADWLKDLVCEYGLLLMDADMGAKTQLYVAVSPAVAGVSGAYFSPVGVRSSMSRHASDIALQERLWSASEAMVAPFL